MFNLDNKKSEGLVLGDAKKKSDKSPLSDIAPAMKKRTVHLTPGDRKLLVGYTMVKREKWDGMPLGSFIRFMNSKGELKLGGELLGRSEYNGEKYLTIRGLGKTNYNLYYNKIFFVWKQDGPPARTTQSSQSREPTATTAIELTVPPGMVKKINSIQRNIGIINKFMIEKYGDEYRGAVRSNPVPTPATTGGSEAERKLDTLHHNLIILNRFMKKKFGDEFIRAAKDYKPN